MFLNTDTLCFKPVEPNQGSAWPDRPAQAKPFAIYLIAASALSECAQGYFHAKKQSA
jgi:hypothetical protein